MDMQALDTAADRAATPRAGNPGRLRQWWLDRSVRTKGMTVVAVPLIALVATATASLVLQYHERSERSVAQAAFAFVNAAGQVQTDALNAETGVRGYAATHRTEFLDPYNQAQGQMGAALATLRTTARAEDLTRQERMIGATTRQAFSEFGQLRAAVSSGGPASSVLTQLSDSKTTMDQLRSQIGQVTKDPSAQLIVRRSHINGLESAIGGLNIAGLALGVVAGLIGVALFTTGISRRVVGAAANSDRLGQGQPLQPVNRSRDELGRLADSLGRAAELLDSRTAELTAARDDALKANQAKNAFLSSTSHELRTPLNSILGFTQLLELAELTDEDQDSVQRILSAGRHLLNLINELIDIARIESGDLSLSLEPVALQPLIEQVMQLMAPLAADRSVQLSMDCQCPGLAVLADRQRLTQVLVNLASNAVKYNRSGGSLTISCESDDGQASVIVADTGQGMTNEDLDRIFLPFERLGAEQTGVEGTGIGLPLTQALTEAMSGKLTASSVVGEGSVFTVSLKRTTSPDATEPAPPPPARPARPQPAAHAITNMRIIYIEDNPANVEVVARYLRGRPGTRLRSFSTGAAGLQAAREHDADLILLDLHLQDTHGEHVLIDLKAEPVTADIPVAILSADATSGAIRRLMARGALAYLTKPLDLAELGRLLDSLESAADQPGTQAT